MGFENRDYTRDGSYTRIAGGEAFLEDSPVCKWLIIATVAVFLLQIFWTRPAKISDSFGQGYSLGNEQVEANFPPELLGVLPKVSVIQEWLQLDSAKVVYRGQIWRLLTSAFCHDRFGVWHLAINLCLLFYFGRTIESLYGSKEFLLFYLLAAIVASLTFVGLQFATGDRAPAIGASGAVMAIMCVYTMWYPRDTINVMFYIPIEMRFVLLLYVAYDLHPILLQLSGAQMFTGVAHSAHLGGLLFGYLYWRNSWQLARYWNPVEKRITSNRSMASNPSRGGGVSGEEAGAAWSNSSSTPARKNVDDRLEQEVDDILRKISESGEDGLTPRERKLLQQASQRYRDR